MFIASIFIFLSSKRSKHYTITLLMPHVSFFGFLWTFSTPRKLKSFFPHLILIKMLQYRLLRLKRHRTIIFFSLQVLSFRLTSLTCIIDVVFETLVLLEENCPQVLFEVTKFKVYLYTPRWLGGWVWEQRRAFVTIFSFVKWLKIYQDQIY